jgi:hypothetical protein
MGNSLRRMSTKANGADFECWRLDGTDARMTTNEFSGIVDVARPGLGLHQLRCGELSRDWNLMRISAATADSALPPLDAAWQLSDVYVRGCDLVASYREPLELPFNVQIYWRAIECQAKDQLVLETIISVHTRTWETYPIVCVDSSNPSTSIVASQGDAIHLRDEKDRGYVELSHPGDFSLIDDTARGRADGKYYWQYGPLFMERGVIRRLRLRGVFLPQGELACSIEQLRADFLAAELPLTV